MNSILILVIGGLIFTAFQHKSEKKRNMILIGTAILIFFMFGKEGLTQIFVPGAVTDATCTETLAANAVSDPNIAALCAAATSSTCAAVTDNAGASQCTFSAAGVGAATGRGVSGVGDARFTELSELFPSCTLGKMIKADGTCGPVTTEAWVALCVDNTFNDSPDYNSTGHTKCCNADKTSDWLSFGDDCTL